MVKSKIQKREYGSVAVEDLTKKILRERAVILAKELKTEKTSKSFHFLEFQLADEYYCLATTEIKEVYPLKEYTRIPCTPDFIFGVMNFHGQILSIVDLKKVLNLSNGPLNEHNKIIILESKDMTFGIMTDNILGIKEIEEDSIQKELPSGIDMSNSHYISGITKDGRIILNSSALLADPKMLVNG